MLEPTSGSEEAWLDGMGSRARYHLQSEAVHQSMACKACCEAGKRQVQMLERMWLREARQRQRTCGGRRPCSAKAWACVRCRGVICVDPMAGPCRQGRQNLCGIAQQVLRRRGLRLRRGQSGRHGGGC